jgi:hypothetical protein
MSEEYRRAIASLKTENAPERVEQNVLAAFRRQKRSRVERRWGWGAAVAAAVVLAAVGAYRIQQPSSVAQPMPLLAHIAAPPPVASAPSAPKLAVRRSPRVAKRQEEIATPYFALPGAESLPSPDAEAVVHMVVPRSTLQLVGFPVSEVPRPEFIRADVVVGQDGMARAIRFVQ